MSRQNLLGDDPRHIGQTEVATAVAVGQALVIEAQQAQYRGVEIVYVEAVFDGVIADVVGGAVDEARLGAAARHPDRITIRVVVAPVAALADRRARSEERRV